MQTKNLFRLSSLLIISILMAVWSSAILNSPPKLVKADPLFEKQAHYEEFYEVLQDGSIIITRNQVIPEPIQAADLSSPTAPVLLEPSDGAILSTLIPHFTWEQVSYDVIQYTFQLSRSSDFSTVDDEICEYVPNQPAGSPIYYPTFDNLLPDTIYYWHVASGCIGIPPEWYSPAFSFRTAPAGGVILPAPKLLAPADGATTGSTRVTFSLEPVNGAMKYQYRYSYDQDDGWDL